MRFIADVSFHHRRNDVQQRLPGAGAGVCLFGEAQHFRMTRGNFQQLIDAMARSVIFITSQLQANASDFHRDQVIARQLGGALQMLVGPRFIAALLGRFRRQQIVHHRLFGVIGIFRHQLLNLLVITFRQLKQRLLGLLTRATAFTADKPAARMRPGAENAAQQPFNGEQHHHGEDQDDHQPGHAGLDIVIIGLDQDVALMPGDHRAKHDPGDQQCEE